jgi:uncharacterized integral membrane protein (TIGR00697 family)
MNLIKNVSNLGYKFLSCISMISVTLLITAMIFTYRSIEIGPFLTPGGIIPFATTYVIAAMVCEVYGYNNAKKLIFGNFACIFIFNITIVLLLKLPSPTKSVYDSAYELIFNKSIYTMIMYSVGFLVGDLVNAFCISKWNILTKGKHFISRLIGASAIGQIFFSIIVIPMLYGSDSNSSIFLRQFVTTVLAKILIIVILSYPIKIIKRILMKVENINPNEQRTIFNPFLTSN